MAETLGIGPGSKLGGSGSGCSHWGRRPPLGTEMLWLVGGCRGGPTSTAGSAEAKTRRLPEALGRGRAHVVVRAGKAGHTAKEGSELAAPLRREEVDAHPCYRSRPESL